MLGGAFYKVSLIISKRERETRGHEMTVNVMQTFELGMKQCHSLGHSTDEKFQP